MLRISEDLSVGGTREDVHRFVEISSNTNALLNVSAGHHSPAADSSSGLQQLQAPFRIIRGNLEQEPPCLRLTGIRRGGGFKVIKERHRMDFSGTRISTGLKSPSTAVITYIPEVDMSLLPLEN